MSTKKEKLNFENLICKLPHCKCMQQFPCSNHHYSDECFSTNDHSKSESIEWEKNLDYNSTDFGEMGKFIRVEYAKNILEKAITTAVSNREKEIAEEVEKKQIDENTSDGYHTFKELYEFRKIYNAVLFNEWARQGKYNVHKSLKHSDGEDCFGGGWFIVTATLPSGQISNHYELKDWKLFRVDEHVKADEWDGHTAQDVVARLLSILKH